MLVHYLPDMSRSRQSLFHAVMQTRKFPHRVITAEQKDQECQELGSVHSTCKDFTLAKEQQYDDSQNANHLYRRGSKSRDTGTSKICPDNPTRNFRKALLLSCFRGIGFNYVLVGQRLL